MTKTSSSSNARDESGDRKTQVLVVDDHAVVRVGVCARLAIEMDLEVCGQAATANEAMKLIEALEPDVVILDLGLEGSSGLDLLKDLDRRGCKTKVLVISGQDEAIYADRCVRAGAYGFLSKSLAVDEIVDGIRCVRRGDYYVSKAVASQIFGRLSSSRDKPNTDRLAGLSDRELQVYEAIGFGLSVKEIGVKLFLSPKTVDTYRAKLKQKLGLDSSQLLTRHAMLWALEQTRR